MLLTHLCVFVASDAKEQQFWISQLQACARRHSDSSAKVTHTRTHTYTHTRNDAQGDRVVNMTLVRAIGICSCLKGSERKSLDISLEIPVLSGVSCL